MPFSSPSVDLSPGRLSAFRVEFSPGIEFGQRRVYRGIGGLKEWGEQAGKSMSNDENEAHLKSVGEEEL